MRMRNYLDFPSSLSREEGFSIPLNAGFISRESVATKYNAPMTNIVACSPNQVTFYKNTSSSEACSRFSFTLLDKCLFL
jgi:hypothetical protein